MGYTGLTHWPLGYVVTILKSAISEHTLRCKFINTSVRKAQSYLEYVMSKWLSEKVSLAPCCPATALLIEPYGCQLVELPGFTGNQPRNIFVSILHQCYCQYLMIWISSGNKITTTNSCEIALPCEWQRTPLFISQQWFSYWPSDPLPDSIMVLMCVAIWRH